MQAQSFVTIPSKQAIHHNVLHPQQPPHSTDTLTSVYYGHPGVGQVERSASVIDDDDVIVVVVVVVAQSHCSY